MPATTAPPRRGADDPTLDLPGGPWHDVPVPQACAALHVDPGRGLEDAEADRRLARVGPNQLGEAPRRPPWLLFLDQFRNLLVVVLLAAAVLAGLIGDLKDTVVVGTVLLFNAVLGFVQEHRAERSLAALKRMLVPTAKVRRHGDVREVPAETLVPGDVVLLAAGDRVPADGRLVATTGVEIDESALTGESTPVAKSVPPAPAAAPLAERSSMAHMNSVVTRGRAEVLVTATGMGTEMGRLAGLLQRAGEAPTPLQVRLDALARRLALVAAVAVGLFVALGLVRGGSLADTLLAAVALAVAAIPEGLPAVVTVTLAVGVHRMARRGAIVKRLASVETLGSTTVICSDKTGTLTLNEMTARAVIAGGTRYRVTGEGYGDAGAILDGDGRDAATDVARVLRLALACNDSRVVAGAAVGDPTEAALVALAAKGGVERTDLDTRLPRIAEVPFDSTRKYMATFHRDAGSVLVAVKGGADVLLARCDRIVAGDGGERALDAAARSAVLGAAEDLAREGLRVLAIAERRLPPGSVDAGEEDLVALVDHLALVGLVGLLDPPRPQARQAIALCRRAGIAVKMITGDHAVTATAIAAQLGLGGSTLSGADLDGMSDDELAGAVERTDVFARVAPEHKVRLVAALRTNGHVVAMTGDGVNDAPALKSADIGVAMGVTGTEVSKEAAAMVLTDDDFSTIVRAVEAGRTIYGNIVKFVRFQLSTNIGAIASLLGAQVIGLPVPFTALQVLWVNLIMDGPPAMALGVDPPERGTMDRPPRDPSAPILTARRLARLCAYGAVMAAGTLGVLAFGTATGDEERALTLAFTTFVLFQVFNAFNARSESQSALGRHSLRNGKLWLALAAVVVLQVAAVHAGPVSDLFGTVALGAGDWAVAAAVASSVLWIDEARKALAHRRAPERG
ncbi:MAG TPA: cation-translocating P-type ATPase [Acidimicrobiales bacterium]